MPRARRGARVQCANPHYDERVFVSGFGVEVECLTKHNLFGSVEMNCVEVVDDGSVYDDYSNYVPCELRFGPFEPLRTSRRMDEPIARFRERYNEIADMAGDMQVNSSCGLHIHIGLVNQDGDAIEQWWNNRRIMRLIRTWRYFEPVFYAMVPSSRRNSSWCRPLREWSLAEVRSLEMYRECSMNLHAMHRHGTIEFRLPNATIDVDEICGWITTLVAFVQMSLRTPLVRHAEHRTTRLLSRQRYLASLLGDDAKSFINDRVRKHRGSYLAGTTLPPVEIRNATNQTTTV